MYIRIYPNKNTTIFKNNSGSLQKSGVLNTGKNTISEIMSGGGQSTFLLQFDITSIKTLLQNYPFTCNLQLFDAGVIFEPSIQLTTLDLVYFREDFSEGDGWFFITDKTQNYQTNGASYINRVNGTPWYPIQPNTYSMGLFPALQLNDASQDLTINNLQSFITDSITNNINPNFGLRISPETSSKATITITGGSINDTITNITVNSINIINNQTITYTSTLTNFISEVISTINTSQSTYLASRDIINPNIIILEGKPGLGSSINNFNLNVVYSGLILIFDPLFLGGVNGNFISGNDIYTKFLYTRHTRTIFKPYLEFYINSDIIDYQQFTTALQTNNYYLINFNNINFSGPVTATITDSDGTIIITPTVLNTIPGRYEIQYTPLVTDIGQIYSLNWFINGVQVKKNLININSPDLFLEKDLTGLYFYPTTSYTHSQIRKNEKVKFDLISEIKSKGFYLSSNYQYKVESLNGFQMIPWSPVSIYNNEMFFYIDTSFFFEENDYEVFVRYNDNNISKTSNITYKFRLMDDTATFLREKNASPYNKRDERNRI